MRRRALAVVICGLLGVVGTAVVAEPAHASAPLRTHAAERGKLIGTAVATNQLSTEAPYRDAAAREFNAVTAENAMKWDATEPSRGQFSFGGADQVMAFAQTNNQVVHGHTLVWHSQTPGWVQGLDATQLRAAMQTHVDTVVGRYAGRIAAWDVVNEVFEENGTLRNSFWLQRLGSGYIAEAFRLARAADPTAKLYINDYNVEGQNAKSNAMYNLVRDLRAQGVPIDGVGLQTHLAIQFGFPGDLQQNIQRFANLGVDVKITELDVRMQLPADATKLATQATYYRNVVDACLAVARCVGVTIWGFTDRYSWVPDTFPGQGAALPYNENYGQKPAYAAVHDALDDGGGPVDTTPPSTPGAPVASNPTLSSLTLTWPPSTDNVGVVGYDVHRALGSGAFAVVGTPATNTFTDTGLAAGTIYRYFVRARDAALNRSADSPTITATTQPGGPPPPPPGNCRVAHTVSNWGGTNGFTASLAVTNTGTAPITNWTLAFAYTAGQRLTPPGWSAVWAQNGSIVTATPLDWNRTISPGTTITIGFNGTHSGSNPTPTTHSINGSNCTTV